MTPTKENLRKAHTEGLMVHHLGMQAPDPKGWAYSPVVLKPVIVAPYCYNTPEEAEAFGCGYRGEPLEEK